MTTLSENSLINMRRSKRASKDAILLLLVLFGIIQLFTDTKLPQDDSSCSPQQRRPPWLQKFKQADNYNCMPIVKTSPNSQACVINELNQACEEVDAHYNQNSCSSSSSASYKISKAASNEEATTLLTRSARNLARYLSASVEKLGAILNSGPRIVVADALSLYQPSQDKEIIILNSTNFNSELIQYRSPFPHIKLIEYYVSFCGFCTKFKTTYTRLAKEIYPWRNVIRPSAIDLGVSSNSPIAHSWSVEVVPTLKMHPPVNQTLARRLDESNSEWTKSLTPAKLHRRMFDEFEAARPRTKSLESVAEYMDKVSRLKSDILSYIGHYLASEPREFPETWPNLLPVTESTLYDLRQKHPRKELFLIVDASHSQRAASDSDQSSRSTNLGLNTMLELSSSAAWKAIRYVRASDNKALIEDVILQLKKTSDRQSKDQQPNSQSLAQIEALNNALKGEYTDDSILLVHIDDSHAPVKGKDTAPSAIPSMTVVTGSDLVSMDSVSGDYKTQVSGKRVKRSMITSDGTKFDQFSTEQKVDLIATHVKQAYTETTEDRLFLDAMKAFDEDVTIRGEENKLVKKFSVETRKGFLDRGELTIATESLAKLPAVFESLNPQRLLSQCDQDEYEDKLKAIHYILFHEIPRKSTNQRNSSEIQEYLNTVVNLVAVIKTYFPLPDSSSIQFIDGVQSYLIKQQAKLLSAIHSNREGSEATSNSQALFDLRAFKNELKRLESEGKQLPEIKEWKHCKHSGYPCALWRLFHTLTAFEYKKLSQIYQVDNHLTVSQPKSSTSTASQSTSVSSEGISNTSNNNYNHNADHPASPQQGEPIMARLESARSNGSSLTPVERLVSPPSTTTSLSLTIATPTSLEKASNKSTTDIADLPMPVILVMRDYITNFYQCEECVRNFRQETLNLSVERIRQQESAEFSILWLWEVHNSVNKRLSVDIETNPIENPKVWFPTYNQCPECYNKPPSFLNDASVEPAAIFHESIEWNRQAVLCFLLHEFTKQPMDNVSNIFGYQVPYGYVFVTCICCVIFYVLLRCASYYVERQRRHKATLLNGNGAHYTMELQ